MKIILSNWWVIGAVVLGGLSAFGTSGVLVGGGGIGTYDPPDSRDLPPAMFLQSGSPEPRNPTKELLLGVAQSQGITYTSRIQRFEQGPDNLVFQAYGSDNEPVKGFNDAKPLAISLDLPSLGIRRDASFLNEATLVALPDRGVMLIMNIRFWEGERFVAQNPKNLPYDNTLLMIGIDSSGNLLNYFVRGEEVFAYTFLAPLVGEASFYSFEGAAAVDSEGQLLIAVTARTCSPGAGTGEKPTEVVIFRLNSQGIDPSFGVDGFTRIAVPTRFGFEGVRDAQTQSLQIAENGRVVVSGQWREAGYNSDGFFRVLMERDGQPVQCGGHSQACVYRTAEGAVVPIDNFSGAGIAPGFFVSRFPAFAVESPVFGDRSVRWNFRSEVTAYSNGDNLSVLLPSWRLSSRGEDGDRNDSIRVDLGTFGLSAYANRPHHFEAPYVGTVIGRAAPMESLAEHLTPVNPIHSHAVLNPQPYELRLTPTGEAGRSLLWGTLMTEDVRSHAYYHASAGGGINDEQGPVFGPPQRIEFDKPECVRLLAAFGQ